MNYSDVGIIILAAGKGTRMKSDKPKVLHKVAGKSMVMRVIEIAKKITHDNIHIVVGHKAKDVRDEINKYVNVNFANQKQLIGTGDAVKSALPGMDPSIKDILVLCGDVPLIQEDTIKDLIDKHKENQAIVSVLAVDLDDPGGYGRIVLDEFNNMLCIKEEADANAEEKKIKTVNTGIYCFDKKFLVSALEAIKPDNMQAEYYLTDVVEIAQKKSEKIIVVTMNDYRQVIGVNTLEQRQLIENLIQQMEK
ncbi:NTP transferase domain-containing protein [Desulfobacterales bacterium HSG17]|nr:NTP transferase domain-containing protein [Desulfobacterales bacterium HSG17]